MSVIYGRRPVLVALTAGRRRVTRLWILSSGKGERDEVAQAAARQGATVVFLNRNDLSKRAGSTSHQGVVAEVEPLPRVELETVLGDDPDLLLVLDGVQDPHNLGAVLRSAACAGGRAVVIPRDRATGLTAAAVKVAEGAAERIPVVEVTNLRRALEQMKSAGLWCVGLDAEADQDWDQADLARRTALVLGSEGRGLRPLVRRTCDLLLALPVASDMGSLNVSAAAAVGLYEVVRQRRVG